jgi:hypothetical protein
MRTSRTRSGSVRSGTLWAIAVVVAACADSSAPNHDPPPPPRDIHLLALETFDGSGQAVHPDLAETPPSWDGAARQLTVTPYPNGDASKENPSLFSARSFRDWFVPEGIVNPIAVPATGYLSDPDQLYNPDLNELWLYYRGVTSENQIFLIRAGSPTQRSSPLLVASGPNHTIVSPSVVRRGPHDWLMWSVNSGSIGCSSPATTVELRRSTDGVTWTDPVITDLGTLDPYPWHIDVEWIPSRGEFWAVYNVKVAGSCTTAALHFATSTDGLAWNPASSPVLVRGEIPAFADIVYRAAISYDPATELTTLFYSGARFEHGGYTWRVATEQLALDAFLRRLAAVTPGEGTSVTGSPPLTDATAP